MPLLFQLNHFLGSRAEIHQIFTLFFWKIEDTKKVILRLSDLQLVETFLMENLDSNI